MPAPNQANKSSMAALQKRTTRNSTKVSLNSVADSKSSTLATRKASVASKNENSQDLLNKRKAEKSPFADKTLKRSAFVDITNESTRQSKADDKKKVNAEKIVKRSGPVKTTGSKLTNSKTTVSKSSVVSTTTVKTNVKQQCVPQQKTNNPTVVKKPVVVIKKTTLGTISEVAAPVGVKQISNTETKLKQVTEVPAVKPLTRQSVRLSDAAASSSDESSLYVSALEELNLSEGNQTTSVGSPKPPPGVEDFDKENWNDPYQISHYAFDIFAYLKSREGHYKIPDYLEKQTALTKNLRSLLIDWMVEVQESFELTHETLYLAVKIVDKYLSKVLIPKETLQLVGATSIFIASKFDERSPPVLDDIVYIGDQAYTDKNVIETEIKILKNLDFDLGFPLSYRFLRRYARCSKASMELLTLARFILEYCLMDYYVVTASDSKLAAAALHIARIMKKVGVWDATLEYYSGYKLSEFKDVCVQLNEILHKKPRTSLATIRNKYSHEIFFAVAKTPLVNNEDL